MATSDLLHAQSNMEKETAGQGTFLRHKQWKCALMLKQLCILAGASDSAVHLQCEYPAFAWHAFLSPPAPRHLEMARYSFLYTGLWVYMLVQ